MNEPTVCAVMLTGDRTELALRAREYFRNQTYPNKYLFIYDSGTVLSPELHSDDHRNERWLPSDVAAKEGNLSIGRLRNRANRVPYSDIIIHWDDDDYSHPHRIAEQVALLRASPAECVGYNEMLFWDERSGEAWLYSNPDPRYCLGTSLCYWRSAWERRPFESTSQGEDCRWLMGVKSKGVSSVHVEEPRMIARIHSGNTSNAYAPEKMRTASEWRRAPEWDTHCRKIMSR